VEETGASLWPDPEPSSLLLQLPFDTRALIVCAASRQDLRTVFHLQRVCKQLRSEVACSQISGRLAAELFLPVLLPALHALRAHSRLQHSKLEASLCERGAARCCLSGGFTVAQEWGESLVGVGFGWLVRCTSNAQPELCNHTCQRRQPITGLDGVAGASAMLHPAWFEPNTIAVVLRWKKTTGADNLPAASALLILSSLCKEAAPQVQVLTSVNSPDTVFGRVGFTLDPNSMTVQRFHYDSTNRFVFHRFVCHL
jgi:hypothetical protein